MELETNDDEFSNFTEYYSISMTFKEQLFSRNLSDDRDAPCISGYSGLEFIIKIGDQVHVKPSVVTPTHK